MSTVRDCVPGRVSLLGEFCVSLKGSVVYLLLLWSWFSLHSNDVTMGASHLQSPCLDTSSPNIPPLPHPLCFSYKVPLNPTFPLILYVHPDSGSAPLAFSLQVTPMEP